MSSSIANHSNTLTSVTPVDEDPVSIVELQLKIIRKILEDRSLGSDPPASQIVQEPPKSPEASRILSNAAGGS